MEELKECLAQSNSSELVCLAKMFDALQVYKENGMSDSMRALTEVIDSGVNRSHY